MKCSFFSSSSSLCYENKRLWMWHSISGQSLVAVFRRASKLFLGQGIEVLRGVKYTDKQPFWTIWRAHIYTCLFNGRGASHTHPSLLRCAPGVTAPRTATLSRCGRNDSLTLVLLASDLPHPHKDPTALVSGLSGGKKGRWSYQESNLKNIPYQIVAAKRGKFIMFKFIQGQKYIHI